MQAKLKENLYTLTEGGIRQQNQNDGANVLSLVLTDVEDLDTLRADATDCEEIAIMDGEVVKQTFEDYTKFRSLFEAEGETTVTVQQENLVKQVAVLRGRVADQAATIAEQAQTIAQQEQTIESQAAEIASLNNSQEAQDANIDYIAMMTDVELPEEGGDD